VHTILHSNLNVTLLNELEDRFALLECRILISIFAITEDNFMLEFQILESKGSLILLSASEFQQYQIQSESLLTTFLFLPWTSLYLQMHKALQMS